jgi:hypothetical protein
MLSIRTLISIGPLSQNYNELTGTKMTARKIATRMKRIGGMWRGKVYVISGEIKSVRSATEGKCHIPITTQPHCL